MSLSVHLTFRGDCAAAFRFYQRCLDGILATSVTSLTYGETPMASQVPAEWADKVVHASLKIGDTVLAGADLLPADYQPPRGFFVLLDIEDTGHAERLFHALSENGTVQVPIHQTFWAQRYGVVIDQFGIPWEINSGRPV